MVCGGPKRTGPRTPESPEIPSEKIVDAGLAETKLQLGAVNKPTFPFHSRTAVESKAGIYPHHLYQICKET
jgi:hypothetical protein